MALSVSPDDKRFLAVHFTSAMEYTYVTYITSKPTLYYSWKTVFTALDKIIWALVLLSIVATSCVIHVVNICLSKPLERKAMPSKMIETALYLVGNIVGQEIPVPKPIASKCTYLAWLFYGLVIGAVYSCSLQAEIVSPGLDYIPKTFRQLVNSPYSWGAASAFRNGLGEQLFKNSKNPGMRLIYRKMEGDSDEVACTRKAMLAKYACFNWELMQRFHLVTEFADKSGRHTFQSATETTFFTSLNFITRKRELFRSHFNNFIARSFDSGLVKQTIARDWRGYRREVVKARKNGKGENLSQRQISVDGPRPFKFDNVKGGFILLYCGIISSFLFFFVEKLAWNRSKLIWCINSHTSFNEKY